MDAAQFSAVMAQVTQQSQVQMQQLQQQHAVQLQQLAAQLAPPAAAPRGPRFAAPTTFDGRAGALDDWKADMLRQFEWYNSPADADRIRVASAHLKGPAGDWWTTLAANARPTTWPLFLAAVESRFQPVNSAEIARTKLYALAQGKQTVNEYVDHFRRLLARIPDMGAPDQFHQFRRGLRPAIVTQLDVQNPPITTLDAAINLAVRVGSRFEMQGAPASSSSSSSSGHHAPMELDNIEGLEGDTTATDAADAPITRAEMKLMLAAMQDTRRAAGASSTSGSSSGSSSSRNNRHVRFSSGQSRFPTVPHLTPEQVK